MQPGEAGLLVGNLGSEPMQILIDGATAGEVAPGRSQSFRLTPGTHAVQARAAGHGSAVRRIALRAGATARMAFDIPRRSHPAPEPVQEVTFRKALGARIAGDAAAGLAFVAVLIAILVVAIGVMAIGTGTPFAEAALEEWEDLAPFAWVLPGVGVLFGLAGMIFPMPLTLDPDGAVFPAPPGGRKKIGWDAIEQISVIGDRPDAWIVLWQRKGDPPPWCWGGAFRVEPSHARPRASEQEVPASSNACGPRCAGSPATPTSNSNPNPAPPDHLATDIPVALTTAVFAAPNTPPVDDDRDFPVSSAVI